MYVRTCPRVYMYMCPRTCTRIGAESLPGPRRPRICIWPKNGVVSGDGRSPRARPSVFGIRLRRHQAFVIRIPLPFPLSSSSSLSSLFSIFPLFFSSLFSFSFWAKFSSSFFRLLFFSLLPSFTFFLLFFLPLFLHHSSSSSPLHFHSSSFPLPLLLHLIPPSSIFPSSSSLTQPPYGMQGECPRAGRDGQGERGRRGKEREGKQARKASRTHP